MKNMKKALSLCLVLVMLFAMIIPMNIATLNASAIAGGGLQQSSYRAYGADLSFWNVSSGGTLKYSLVDFAKMKADGCQYVILRIGFEGSSSRTNTLDTAFLEYYNRARAAGMPMGVYFYSLATTYAGAQEDANWVADQIEKYGMYFEYPIYYDVEDSTYTYQTSLGSSAMTSLCLGWCETLEARGYFPGVYGGKSQVLDKLSADFKSRYDLWYPRVAVNGHGTQYNPKNYDFSDMCSMWQYAWYDYEYDGIGMDMLDVNVCYKDYPSIMTKYGYNNCKLAESEAKRNLRDLISTTVNLSHHNYNEATLEAIRLAVYEGNQLINNESSTDAQFTAKYNELQGYINSTVSILSKGKSYTVSSNPRSDDYADDGDCLTNGYKAMADGSDFGYAGWQKQVEIVVDLGSAQTSDTYTTYLAAGSWGIHLPKENYFSVEVLTSNSATSGFTSVGSSGKAVLIGGTNQEENGWSTYSITVSGAARSARYVKFIVKNDECTGHIWLSEVEVSKGAPSVSNSAYIKAINERITSGACTIFNSSFGTISTSTANHAWTVNVIAQYSSVYNAYVVTSTSIGNGNDTPDINLVSGQILIAAHNWEGDGIEDPVVGSAANAEIVKSAKVGDLVYFSGLDINNGYVTAGSFITFRSATARPANESASHYPGDAADCENDQICTACGNVVTPATGHTEGEWETLEDGTQVLHCATCGDVIDTKDAAITGDVNADGLVDLFDYLLVKSIYNGKTMDSAITARADVNKDGWIDVFDYLMIKTYCF